MLKKSITYTDFNGDEQTEDFYFNLTRAELVELELSHKGGLKESLEKIVADEDGKQIIEQMKNIVLGSYGVKSPDGKRFVKNQQLREEFESSEAYSVLFMELVTETDAAVAFVNGIMPKGMTVDENQVQLPVSPPANPGGIGERYADGVDIRSEPKLLSRQQVLEMDPAELQSGIAEGKYKLVKD